MKPKNNTEALSSAVPLDCKVRPFTSPRITEFREKFNYEKLFRKHTSQRKTKHGFCVKCRKGLWRVDAPTKSKAIAEAMRYFAQYYADGEYA
jgi:hypothetical protein